MINSPGIRIALAKEGPIRWVVEPLVMEVAPSAIFLSRSAADGAGGRARATQAVAVGRVGNRLLTWTRTPLKPRLPCRSASVIRSLVTTDRITATSRCQRAVLDPLAHIVDRRGQLDDGNDPPVLTQGVRDAPARLPRPHTRTESPAQERWHRRDRASAAPLSRRR